MPARPGSGEGPLMNSRASADFSLRPRVQEGLASSVVSCKGTQTAHEGSTPMTWPPKGPDS